MKKQLIRVFYILVIFSLFMSSGIQAQAQGPTVNGSGTTPPHVKQGKALKLPALLLYPATALVLQRLGTRMFDARLGWWSVLAFATLPLVSALGLVVSTDALLLFFWAAATLALWTALEKADWKSWLLVGLWSGLGLMR